MINRDTASVTVCAQCRQPIKDAGSSKRRFCGAKCRKRYQRAGQGLQESYNIIMREIGSLRMLAKSHPHLTAKIADTARQLRAEVSHLILITWQDDNQHQQGDQQ